MSGKLHVVLEKHRFKSPLARGIVVALIVAGLAGLARCQDADLPRGVEGRAPLPEYIQEFFLSDAVRSQDRCEVQVTFATYSQHGVGSNAEVHVEYGFTDRLQISFEVPYGITHNQQEDEDRAEWNALRVGTLYQIVRSDRPFALSAGLMIEAPVRPGD